MNQFSISQLSRFSGIKAHTIRIWEQRYDALQPDRTEGNTRFYNSTQLRRLLNIASLQEQGYKVSTLCTMPDKQLNQLVADELVKKAEEPKTEYFISQLISAGISYNEQHFDKIFSNCLVSLGLKDAYSKVIYPMLDRLGMLWASDNIIPASEHFISNLIRQKVFTAIDALPPADKQFRWLLFLPQGELHELGLLLANYLLRQAGYQVIYLGADVPSLALDQVIGSVKPNSMLLFIVHKEESAVLQEIIKELEGKFRGNIYIACSSENARELKSGKKTKFLHSAADLEQLLTKGLEGKLLSAN